MYLSELRIRNFRCLASVEFNPHPGLNFILGDNGSGKSSLLEAIYFLGRGRSFRPSSAHHLARHGSSGFAVRATAVAPERRPQRLAAVAMGGETRFRVGTRRDARLVDLVQAMPVQVIDPNLHRLLEDGPSMRRRYLDWGVFHVEHSFYPAWRRYRRALSQRNAALRRGAAKNTVAAWDAELVTGGETVDACRRRYIATLRRRLPGMVGAVLGETELTLEYYPGWRREEPFADALNRGLAGDQRSGFTHVGPHRADLRITVGATRARDWVSRGQQKLVSAALLLAQAELLEELRGIRPILLIDDLAAELGANYRSTLLRVITARLGQCFVTFLDPSLIPTDVSEAAMFHVEQGQLRSGVG